MPLPRRLLLICLLLTGSVGCDQATKQIAASALGHGESYSWLGDSVRLRLAENTGAFLSLGSRLPEKARFWLLILGVGLLLLGIAAYVVLSRTLDAYQVTALTLLLGGGASNWIDRVINDGRVVDFMNLGIGKLRTGVFNVADLWIMLGAAMLVLHGFRKQPHEAAPGGPGPGNGEASRPAG